MYYAKCSRSYPKPSQTFLCNVLYKQYEGQGRVGQGNELAVLGLLSCQGLLEAGEPLAEGHQVSGYRVGGPRWAPGGGVWELEPGEDIMLYLGFKAGSQYTQTLTRHGRKVVAGIELKSILA